MMQVIVIDCQQRVKLPVKPQDTRSTFRLTVSCVQTWKLENKTDARWDNYLSEVTGAPYACKMTYYKAFSARVPPSIERSSVDGGDGGGLPLMLKADEPATITVNVCGRPAPVVRWYVGATLVQTDRTPTVLQSAPSRDDDGGLTAVQHSLTVETVTDELEQGLTVVATNDVGQDVVSFSVKTYKGRTLIDLLTCWLYCSWCVFVIFWVSIAVVYSEDVLLSSGAERSIALFHLTTCSLLFGIVLCFLMWKSNSRTVPWHNDCLIF